MNDKAQMTMKKNYTFHAVLVVLIITFITYYPSINNDFTTWDDSGYITQNNLLKQNSFSDYFTKDKFIMGNYHPLTMITYAIEYSFVELDPKLYHIDNLILHLLNTALVFWFIFLLGGWQIASIVSVLFGVHPMHVESVAWISERKDVLYTFFYLASIIFYIYYLRNNKKIFYAPTFLLFVFSLLSKGQAVTLPITLLLIDYFYHKKFSWKYFINKIPFFMLSVLFGIIAIIAQRSVHVFNSSTITINKIITTDNVVLSKLFHFANLLFERLCIASYGLLTYCYKLLIPINLSIFYPYPKKVDGFLPEIFYLAPLILFGLFVLVFIKWRKNKTVVFALLFFIANIFPLLQLLPVGSSIISDRYSYLPSLGYFFLIAHFVIYLSGYKIEEGKLIASISSSPFFLNRKLILVTLLFPVLIYAYAGNQRCKVWKDSETLYANVLENYPDQNYIQYKLGRVYFDKAEIHAKQNNLDSSKHFFQKAILHFTKSVEINPQFAKAWQGLALSNYHIGRLDLAKVEIDSAISLTPNLPELYLNRSAIFMMLNDTTASLHDVEKAKLLIIK